MSRKTASPDAVLAQVVHLVPQPDQIDVTITPYGTAFTMVCVRCRLDQPMDAFYTGPNRLSRALVCEACREAEEPAPPVANAARSRAAARLIEQYQDRYYEQNGSHGIPLRLRPHPKEEN
jgi:hypothetical protein